MVWAVWGFNTYRPWGNQVRVRGFFIINNIYYFSVVLKYAMDGLSYNNSVCKRSPHFTLLSIPEFKPSGAGYSFVSPASNFKVFEEKRNMQSIVTLVLWSTSAILLFPKFLFMSLSPYIVFSSPEPVGWWPWQPFTVSTDKYILFADTVFKILPESSAPSEGLEEKTLRKDDCSKPRSNAKPYAIKSLVSLGSFSPLSWKNRWYAMSSKCIWHGLSLCLKSSGYQVDRYQISSIRSENDKIECGQENDPRKTNTWPAASSHIFILLSIRPSYHTVICYS